MKSFWNWLLSLFSKKPKELSAGPIDTDDIFLSAFQEEKKRQDEITRQEKEADKKRKLEELVRKKKGVDPKHIKAAFEMAGAKLASPNNEEDIVIGCSNLGISYQEFDLFSLSFLGVCHAKGIIAFSSGGLAVKIIRHSLLEYKRRCEESRTTKPKIITVGAYR